MKLLINISLVFEVHYTWCDNHKEIDDSVVLLQIIAYLLLSASSSAATRIDDWQSNWGKDKFPDMATGSLGFSIVAFVAFALSCIISGYTLCKSA